MVHDEPILHTRDKGGERECSPLPLIKQLKKEESRSTFIYLSKVIILINLTKQKKRNEMTGVICDLVHCSPGPYESKRRFDH